MRTVHAGEVAPPPNGVHATIGPALSGYAVRRDWPDGSHDFIDYADDMPTAVRQAEADRAEWSGSPASPQPCSWSAVPIRDDEYYWHVRRQRRERCVNGICAHLNAGAAG